MAKLVSHARVGYVKESKHASLPSASSLELSFESGDPMPTKVPCITMALCTKLTT